MAPPLVELELLFYTLTVAPCQLNCVWAFRGQSVPRGKAQPYHCTRCCTQPRCTTRWGIGLPVPAQTPPNSRRAGRCGHSSGATGAFVLGLWTGPPETALGLGPRTVKRLHPKGESNCGGADQNLSLSNGRVSEPARPFGQLIGIR